MLSIEYRGSVYISEPLTGQPNVEEIKNLCRRIATVCREFGFNPYLPFDATDPTANPDVSAQNVYLTDKRETTRARLCVFVIPKSPPDSLGVGSEMAWTENVNNPAIVMVEKGKVFEPVTQRLIAGMGEQGLWKVVVMDSLDDEEAIRRFRGNVAQMIDSGLIK